LGRRRQKEEVETSLQGKILMEKEKLYFPKLLTGCVVPQTTFPPVSQSMLQIQKTMACSHPSKISAQDI